jgi:hypothetical protein
MAHGNYECCMICDASLCFDAQAKSKESLCPSCAINVYEETGLRVPRPVEFIAWVRLQTPESLRPVLERLGFESCGYPNPVDAAVVEVLSGRGPEQA